MKIKWTWCMGGRDMFFISIVILSLALAGFILMYIIDPVASVYTKKQSVNPASIQELSEEYVKSYGITIDKPIKYGFVRYHDKGYNAEPEDIITLGSFHEWNDTYYINISVDLYKSPSLKRIVIHETRHMIVEYLKDRHIINLSKYTEEIAQEQNEHYNKLFDGSVYLLKNLDY